MAFSLHLHLLTQGTGRIQVATEEGMTRKSNTDIGISLIRKVVSSIPTAGFITCLPAFSMSQQLPCISGNGGGKQTRFFLSFCYIAFDSS